MKSFYNQTLCYYCSHIEHVHPIFSAHLIKFRSVELRDYYVYTTFGVLTLCNFCVICNSNRPHSFVFEICITMHRRRRVWSCFNILRGNIGLGLVGWEELKLKVVKKTRAKTTRIRCSSYFAKVLLTFV